MTDKNDEVVANLAEANRCYFRQVSENEKSVKTWFETVEAQIPEIAKMNDQLNAAVETTVQAE